MSNLLTLADRCEKASCSDEALDGDIALAIGWTFRKRADVWFCTEADDDSYVWVMPGAPTYQHEGRAWIDSGYYHLDGPPSFTASIDIALTLVPQGLDWRVDTMTGLPGAIVCVPNSWLSHKTAPRLVHGATPALALCAAALIARSHKVSEAPHD